MLIKCSSLESAIIEALGSNWVVASCNTDRRGVTLSVDLKVHIPAKGLNELARRIREKTSRRSPSPTKEPGTPDGPEGVSHALA